MRLSNFFTIQVLRQSLPENRWNKYFKSLTTPILILIVLIAIFLRFFLFTSVPSGINPDEADAGYEAYSLLQNGTDKWGNKWPSYFISWGSGQNVLESYLDIPVIYVGGLNSFTIRLIPAALGVLAVAMLYYVLKLYDTTVALVGSFGLAILPWAVMSSRWGLESNILPFFILFGLFSFIFARRSRYRKYLIPLSLIPFVIALYAYIISLFVIPIVLLGTLIIYRREVLTDKLSYTFSLIIAFIVSIPIDVFIVENYVLHRIPRFAKHLPFSAPLLLQSRLAQINGQANGNLLWANLHFYTSGFVDIYPWANMDGFTPALIYLPLAVIGAVLAFKGANKMFKIFAVWFIANFILSFVVPLDDIRANTFIIPLIALSALTVVTVVKNCSLERKMLSLIIAIMLIGYSIFFYVDYFINYNQQNNTGSFYFNTGFDQALQQARKLAHNTTDIYVSDSINLNYVYTLFYLKADSKDFQRYSDYSIVKSYGSTMFKVNNYRNYYFYPTNPELQGEPYVYILKSGDTIECKKMETTYSKTVWRVGICTPSS